jgi:peroxiredoxin
MTADFKLKSCLLMVSLICRICLAEETGEPILCRTIECNTGDAENVNSKATTADSAKVIYIVSFKPADGSAIRNPKELLDEFNKNSPGGVNTHHFRFRQTDEGIVGRICVDGRTGKETIVEMIAKNRNLVLVSAEPATNEELKELGITNASTAKPATTRGNNRISFALKDSLGREIRSEDYKGTPVLIMCGSCWCGGCQQDAEPLRKFAEQYSPKGVSVIRSVSGDNELAAMDFAKHYRLNFPQILDTNMEFEQRYNKDGWTFLMLADTEGRVVFKCNNPGEEDWSTIKRLTGNMVKTNEANQTTVVEGVRYMNKTLERSGEIQQARQREELASVACADNNRVYVVFTSNRNGNNDIFFRTYNGTQWSGDRPVAATKADEYDGTVIIDGNNRAWAAWTSNADGGKYNIFTAPIPESGDVCEPKRVSIGDDDSMHGRMACNKNGDIWITYYKWQKMDNKSRDKEIFVRRLSKGQWSRQIQVSPTDVPDYEDHTEPTIACDGDDAIVCWSWDFHRPDGYTKKAYSPTIFVRRVDNAFDMSRAAAVSAEDIDVTPGIGIINGQIWCAWDRLKWDKRLNTYRKSLCLARAAVTGEQDSTEILTASEPAVNVCSPTIAVGKNGRACVVWSETTEGNKWILKMAEFDAESNQWKTPTSIESNGNPRFCSAGYDKHGKLWIAYSDQTQDGRRIVVKQL